MGALAIFAKQAGFSVCGSDLNEGAVTNELKKEKIEYKIGKQDGKFLREKVEGGEVDWFVYTSALPKDHPELLLAKELGLKVSKRDEVIEFIRKRLKMKMVAVAGTHGKTTTTSMIIYAAKKLGIKTAHLVGSTLSFAEAGEYEMGAKFLIYEADEYDRNFLHFRPWLSVVTVVDYDHPDIYPTVEEYKKAFVQFVRQSRATITDRKIDRKLRLAGKVRRIDASLALEAVLEMAKVAKIEVDRDEVIKVLNEFPGAGRRFERIDEGVYTDYAHHPSEIKATLEIANEEAKNTGNKGVVVVYEPHQNVRQHEIFDQYKKAFYGVDKLFWLPTFLTRENPNLLVYRPEDFIRSLANAEIAEPAEKDEILEKKLKKLKNDGFLVILMSAGPADEWFRGVFG